MGSGASQHSGSIPLPHLNGDLHWSHCAIQGKRESMEDEYVVTSIGNEALFGVFDGHYGKRAAIYAGQNLAKTILGMNEYVEGDFVEALNQGFQQLDNNLLSKSREENWHDGTTALAALLAMAPELQQTRAETPAIPTTTSNKTTAPKPVPKKSRAMSSDSSSNEDSEKTPATSSSEVVKKSKKKSNAEEMDNKSSMIEGKSSMVEGKSFELDSTGAESVSKTLRLFIANAGDCRAISMSSTGRTYQLTTDHTPVLPYERWRIFKAGGTIRFGRIEAKLSVSRGFGDRQFKEPKYLVSAKPEIVSFAVNPDLRFVVLACDGIWGWLTNTQVAKFVNKQLKEGNKPESVCKDLVKFAYEHGSTDNISAILLYFSFNDSTKDSLVASSSSISTSTNSTNTTTSTQNSNKDGKPRSLPPTPLNLSSEMIASTQSPSLSKSSKDGRESSKEAKESSKEAKESSKEGRESSKSGKETMEVSSRDQLGKDVSSSSNNKPSSNKESPSVQPHSGKDAFGINFAAGVKSKKYNFSAIAEGMTWPFDVVYVDKRGDKTDFITTHIPTGNEAVYLDDSQFDSTSELSSDARPTAAGSGKSAPIDRRISCDLSPIPPPTKVYPTRIEISDDTSSSEDSTDELMARNDLPKKKILSSSVPKRDKSPHFKDSRESSKESVNKNGNKPTSDRGNRPDKVTVNPSVMAGPRRRSEFKRNEDLLSDSSSTSEDLAPIHSNKPRRSSMDLPTESTRKPVVEEKHTTPTPTTKTHQKSSSYAAYSSASKKRTGLDLDLPISSSPASDSDILGKDQSSIGKKPKGNKPNKRYETTSDSESEGAIEAEYQRRAVSFDQPRPNSAPDSKSKNKSKKKK